MLVLVCVIPTSFFSGKLGLVKVILIVTKSPIIMSSNPSTSTARFTLKFGITLIDSSISQI